MDKNDLKCSTGQKWSLSYDKGHRLLLFKHIKDVLKISYVCFVVVLRMQTEA